MLCNLLGSHRDYDGMIQLGIASTIESELRKTATEESVISLEAGRSRCGTGEALVESLKTGSPRRENGKVILVSLQRGAKGGATGRSSTIKTGQEKGVVSFDAVAQDRKMGSCSIIENGKA